MTDRDKRMGASKSVTLEAVTKVFRDPQSGQDVTAVAGVSLKPAIIAYSKEMRRPVFSK